VVAKLGTKQLQKSFFLWQALKPRRHVEFLTSFVLIWKQAYKPASMGCKPFEICMSSKNDMGLLI
jgi:hypothetical protein